MNEIADQTIRMLLDGKMLANSHVEILSDKISDDDDFDFMRQDNVDDGNIYEEYLSTLFRMKKGKDLFEFWISKLDTEWEPLAEIAIEYLSIPSSSATAERQFLITGQSLGLNRLKMSEDHVELPNCQANFRING